MTSPKQRVIDTITQRLQTGLTHPGDAQKPETTFMLPGLKSTGIPQEMADYFANEAGMPSSDAPKITAESIVHLITGELGIELVDRAELDQLRAQVNEPTESLGRAPQTNIHCRCNLKQPILEVVTNRAIITINGPTLRDRLDKVCKCR
ncbi:MAG: hypothetical protein VYA67_22060 [Actinomycetota bacterium]|nr:hypothetical protein [Actinomycetota bacterium]